MSPFFSFCGTFWFFYISVCVLSSFIFVLCYSGGKLGRIFCRYVYWGAPLYVITTRDTLYAYISVFITW